MNPKPTHSITPKDLTQIGRLLYGNNFRATLADKLEVNESTVRRWISGDYQMPKGLTDDLITLLEARQISINRELSKLLRKKS